MGFLLTGVEKPDHELENGTSDVVDGTPEHDVWTGETKIVIDLDVDGDVSFRLRTRSKFAKNARWNRDVLHFLYQMQALVLPYIATESMEIYTCHWRNGQTFRGHYRGKGPWKDWVWVDWVGYYGHVPCHSYLVLCCAQRYAIRSKLTGIRWNSPVRWHICCC